MRSQSLDRGIAGVPLADLERNATATQSVYVALLSRLKQAIRQSDLVKADASVASAALLPTQPSFPRAGPILGAALGAAIIFGLIFVLLSEAVDNHVRTASQIYALTGVADLRPDSGGPAAASPSGACRRHLPTLYRVCRGGPNRGRQAGARCCRAPGAMWSW